LSGQILRGYRALDLTSGEAQLCGRILSDLGVEVIQVEKPGGDERRHRGPFFKNETHPEKGLWGFFLNANKKGITLNLGSKDGLGIFKDLVEISDFVLESFPPGHMATLGLDYFELAAVNPRAIVVSMTPFGQHGPYSSFKASELILMALGVFMFGTGDPDRPPTSINYPLALISSAVHASSAAMIAHYHATKTGKGQHIDVSAQAGVPWFTANVGAWWQMAHVELMRTGPYVARRPDLHTRFIWPCKDGYVIFQFYGGVVGSRSNKALAQWIKENNMGDEYFHSINWETLDLYKITQDEVNKLENIAGAFLLTRGKNELAEEATRRGVILGYISRTGDVFQNPHLMSRSYWKNIEHPHLGETIKYPGYFARSSRFEYAIRHRAPTIGEHNAEIFGAIGISSDELFRLNRSGVI
jgi:crotonobetainyl-CoA:carnitine CoA-transferase CaiB-like acyl-CoA transferase